MGEKNVYFTAFIYTCLWKVFIEAMITLLFYFSVTAWKPVEGFEMIHNRGILSAECISAQVTYKVKFCSFLETFLLKGLCLETGL